MSRVYLLRHAHAAAAGAGQGDFDRPLDERGRSEASQVGVGLAESGVQVDAVLCSSARRTVETWQGLCASWSPGVEAELLRGLYLASADELLASLIPLDRALDSVLLVAHNPGIHELAVALAGEGDRDTYQRMRSAYPPGALSELQFDGAWAELRAGVATLRRFDTPGARI